MEKVGPTEEQKGKHEPILEISLIVLSVVLLIAVIPEVAARRPVHGKWGTWNEWGPCLQTCHEPDVAPAYRSRQRECNRPKPKYGGKQCYEKDNTVAVMMDACNHDIRCPRDGNFSEWVNWPICLNDRKIPFPCGKGYRRRTRTCTDPPPMWGGAFCSGPITSYVYCDDPPCPVPGNWTLWEPWSTCTVTCAGGSQTRYRTCTNPPPQHGGSCAGDGRAEQACNVHNCPVDGKMTEWEDWSPCSMTCDNGTHTRNRTCTDPAPAYGGKYCTGNTSDTEMCSLIPCPDEWWLVKVLALVLTIGIILSNVGLLVYWKIWRKAIIKAESESEESDFESLGMSLIERYFQRMQDVKMGKLDENDLDNESEHHSTNSDKTSQNSDRSHTNISTFNWDNFAAYK